MDFSLTTLFVLPSGNLVADGFKRENLQPAQFGIFNSRYKAVTTANEANKSPHIVFGQGRIENVPGLTHKYSDKLSKGSLIEWYKVNGSPEFKNQITYAGFDGVDLTKTLKAGCEEQYSLTIRARSIYLDQAYAYGLTRTVTVTTPCCEDCGDNCESIDPRWLANEFAKGINSESLLSKYFVATPVFDCTTAPTPPVTIPTVTYCVNVCDNGDAASLAAVQAQYPTVVVRRSERVGAISTYQFEQLASAPAPAALVVTLPVRQAVCDVCPATYTLVPARTEYLIQVPLDGTEDLTTPAARQTYATSISTKYTADGGTFLSNNGGYATVKVVSDTALVALEADTVLEIGQTEALCNPPAGTTVAWASCGTGYKVQRTLKITLTDDCGAADLANIQAQYPNDTVTLVESANCNSLYNLVQTSETIHEDCEFGVPPKFPQVQPYKGIEWEVVDGPLTGSGCVAGVKIEGKPISKLTGNGCDPWNFPYEFDKLTFEVFAYRGAPTSQDFLTFDKCHNIPVTTTQKSSYQTGSGDEIFMLEKRYHSYQTTMKDIFHCAEYNGAFVRYSDPQKFYDLYSVKFKSPDLTTWSEDSRQDETVLFAVPVGQGQALENFLVGYFGLEKFTAGVLY